MLQPIDHSTSDRSKHKFMVQAMFPPAEFDPDQLDALVRIAWLVLHISIAFVSIVLCWNDALFKWSSCKTGI